MSPPLNDRQRVLWDWTVHLDPQTLLPLPPEEDK